MGELSAFHVAVLLAQAAMTVVVLLMGVILNHLLARMNKLQERDELLVEDMRALERQIFPRAEFQRFEDNTIRERHALKERVGALEIKAGAWKGAN